MPHKLILYHGSSQIIEHPELGKGKPYNDYGQGFYCTESLELAKEWACGSESDGYVNQYSFDQSDLSFLDLSNGGYHILNWLAILLENRRFRIDGDIAQRGCEYVRENFLTDYQHYDVIKGYRADDSYFSFATAFLNNTISLAQLEKAMVLGKLGEQIVPRTRASFERIKYVKSTFVEKSIYFPKKLARDNEARSEFKREKSRFPVEDELYILDIIRGRWLNDDPRLQRIILG